MKSIPEVQKYMTYLPKSIAHDQTLAEAKDFMNQSNLRHLPVLEGNKLVGLISDRDINLVLQFKDSDATKLKVTEACTLSPYSTSPKTPLNEVVAHMAEKKYGCAVVVDNGKVVGIFTEIDAYKALSELLVTRLTH